MRFPCHTCGAQYVISDDRVGPNGVKVRCKKCGTVIPVKKAAEQVTEVVSLAPAPAEAEAPSGAPRDGELDQELGQALDRLFAGGSADAAPAPADAAGETATGTTMAGATAAGDGPEPLAAVAPASAPPAESPALAAVEAPPAEAIHDWYVAVDDEQVGPLAAPGVRARWESGEIGPDTLAWRPGMADWVPLSSIPEMTSYLTPVARRAGRTAPTPVPGIVADVAQPGALAYPALAASAEPHANGVHNGVHALAASGGHGLNGAANGVQLASGGAAAVATSWQPSAGSALAALASQELAARAVPAAANTSAAVEVKPGSLVDRLDLPDGGVDPTNLLPLPMKGLEKTGEAVLAPKPAAAAEATEIRRIKQSAKRSGLAVGLGAAAVIAIALGATLYLTRPGPEQAAPPRAPRIAQAPVAPEAPAPPAAAAAPASPAAASPASPAAPSAAAAPSGEASAPVASAPAPSGSTATQPAAVVPAPPAPAAAPAAAEPAAAEPAVTAPVAAAPAAREPSRPAAVPAEPPPPAKATPGARPHKMTRREALLARRELLPRKEAPAREPKPRPAQRLASAEAAPAPAGAAPRAPEAAPAEPGRKKAGGDPLLDVGGDDELERELSSGKGKRSVYVPPAMGSELPENVSVSQINEAVVGQKAALLRCIEQQKAADPESKGTLKVRWVIQGDGATRDVRVLSDEFARQPIAPCISGVVKGIRFPRSRTSGQEVVFPFRF